MRNGDRSEVVDETLAAASKFLAERLHALLANTPGGEQFRQGWPDLDATRPTLPRGLPVLKWLADIAKFSTPDLTGLVHAIAERADLLEWQQTYTVADFGPSFIERYGWTELIGRRGPIPSTDFACGLLMLGPETEYPAHAHEAEELYVPLAGAAAWMRGDEGFVVRSVGLPIHHPPWTPHAMRTGPETLLALYVWQGGDLVAKSRILG